jgi:hypothetical protein
MAFTSLTVEETDAKSPVDDRLLEKIREDLDDLDSRVVAAGSSPTIFSVQGRLATLVETAYKRSLDYAFINKEFSPSLIRWCLKKSGTSGTLSFDLRIHTMPHTPITGIEHVYSGSTSAIATRSAAVNTQSIAKATPQILTQSITHAKAARNVQSIIGVESGTWLYNLDAALDSDNLVGDQILFAGCTNAANNGTFIIVEIGRAGGTNVVVANGSGVAQTGVAGTCQPKIMSYNFTNPADSNFAAGEVAVFAAHTSANNDGVLTIFKINQSGNNIWVKNSNGVAQGGVAGTTDTARMKYALSLAANTTDYVVGEYATAAGHTSPLNNGKFVIVAVNSGGNNLVLTTTGGGAVQGGAVGTLATNRWKFSVGTDPTGKVSVGDTVYCASHTNPLNNGTFTVAEVTVTDISVINSLGVAQAGAAGSVYSTKKLVKFASDQSAVYSTSSYIEMLGCGTSDYNLTDETAPFQVYEVNRGGGANYNVVIKLSSANAQASPAGYVQSEMRSIFTVLPSISASVSGLQPNQLLVGSSASLSASVIAAGTPIMLYVTNSMGGEPQDLTVTMV